MQAKTVYSLTAGISIFDERKELGWINYVRGRGVTEDSSVIEGFHSDLELKELLVLL